MNGWVDEWVGGWMGGWGWREVGKTQALRGGQTQSHVNTARQQVPKYNPVQSTGENASASRHSVRLQGDGGI